MTGVKINTTNNCVDQLDRRRFVATGNMLRTVEGEIDRFVSAVNYWAEDYQREVFDLSELSEEDLEGHQDNYCGLIQSEVNGLRSAIKCALDSYFEQCK